MVSAPALLIKRIEGLNDVFLIFPFQSVVKRQAQKTGALPGSIDVFPVETSEPLTCRGVVKRDVVENGQNSVLLEIGEKPVATPLMFRLTVIHRVFVFCIRRNVRLNDISFFRQGAQGLMVEIPALHPVVLNLVRLF